MTIGGAVLFILTLSVFAVLIHRHARRRLAQIRGDFLPGDMKTARRNFTFPKQLINAAARDEAKNPTPPDDPPLSVGDECQLVGNLGPIMTVVDEGGVHVIAAWDDGCQEGKFLRAVVRRRRLHELA